MEDPVHYYTYSVVDQNNYNKTTINYLKTTIKQIFKINIVIHMHEITSMFHLNFNLQ